MNPEPSVAEVIPRTYRAVLDAVARLEQLDAWSEAARLRSQAIETYSMPWNETCRRRLERILARLEQEARTRDRQQLHVA